MVDHYEPGAGLNNDTVLEKARVNYLISRYPELVKNHRDASGISPKRTWFFPPHYHRNESLRKLVGLCEKGYGEIELHLHHGKTKPDTAENLESTIARCIQEYCSFGIFGTQDGIKKYGFVHGDWALCNSRRNRYCGVNDEISVLKKTGCYADFTFPSLNEANPDQINSIYYLNGDSGGPNGHKRGWPVKVLVQGNGNLMLIQGPLFLSVRKNRLLRRGLGGDWAVGLIPVKKRVDGWVNAGIHIEGRPDWIVAKVHAHGGPESHAVLGKQMDDVFQYLEERYNDGMNYVLHYVTARELYNIIKAGEAGESGDPSDYRDYLVKPPTYNSSAQIEEASEELKQMVYKTYRE